MADNSPQATEKPAAGRASLDGNERLSGRNSPARDGRVGSERRDPLPHDSHSDLEDTLDQDDQPHDLTVVSRVSSGPAYSAFSSQMKMWIVAMNCFSAFISPTTANIYFPALPAVARDLGVSIGQVNLSLTTFQIFQGLAPTVFGDLGDGAGRRPAFIIAMIIYLGANIGLALQRDYAALLILRMLQSGGSSGTLAMVYAVVADIAPSSERGRYMGIVGAGITIGPALGPVIGGLLTQYLGWPSIFWFLTVVAVVFLIPYILAVPETCRKIVGNGSIPPQGWNMTLVDYLRTRRRPADPSRPRVKTQIPVPNPFNTLRVLGHRDMAMILLYNAMVYIGFQTFSSTLATQFSAIYHFSDIQLGLCYLPFGVACTIASISQGFIIDWNYRRTAKKLGIKIDRKRGNSLKDFPIERVRIQVVRPLLVVGAAAYIAYGWVMQAELHVAIPLTLSFFIGLCVTGSFQVINTLIVDLYPEAPATATAANNLTRCLLGSVSTALIERMIQAMGRGWAFTLIALVFTVTSPTLWVVQKYGPKYREQRRLKTLEAAKKKEVQEADAQPDTAMVDGPDPSVPETREKHA